MESLRDTFVTKKEKEKKKNFRCCCCCPTSAPPIISHSGCRSGLLSSEAVLCRNDALLIVPLGALRVAACRPAFLLGRLSSFSLLSFCLFSSFAPLSSPPLPRSKDRQQDDTTETLLQGPTRCISGGGGVRPGRWNCRGLCCETSF